jgi:hypothetical protein
MRTLIPMMSYIVVIVLLLSSVQLLCTSECSQGSHPQSRSAASTDDGWGLDEGRGCQGKHDRGPVGNVFGECQSPCTLKTSIVNFEKE